MKNPLTNSLSKFPPYGKILAERQKFKNLPFLTVICAGIDAWQNAKSWQQRHEVCALVLTPDHPPEKLRWPVSGCRCLIEWNVGPGEKLIISLIKSLLASGAKVVIVRPLFTNPSETAWSFDGAKPYGQRWTQCRETIHIYHSCPGVQNVT